MKLTEIIDFFESNADEENLRTMNRLKVGSDRKYGIRMPVLRKLAREIGPNHELALELWNHGYHESRLLATLIEEPDKVGEAQLERWVNDFDAWDLCDQACINLLVRMPLAIEMIPLLAESEREFVQRTAFSLIAVIAVHDKTSDDSYFEGFFPLIKKASCDERNFVKKSVNWAIRSIGKKNTDLNRKAIELCNEMLGYDSKPARWISRNALRELESEKVQNKLN